MYVIRSPYWVIRDAASDRIERLTFHIDNGDYFPFLATVVGMLGETIKAAGGDPMQASFAESTRQDLLWLHERYAITERDAPLGFTKRKVVRFDQ